MTENPPIPSQRQPMLHTLVQMLQSKQRQLDFLSKERKFLEDRINLQSQLWSRAVSSARDQIIDSEGKYKQLKLEMLLQGAKFDLMLGMKEKEAVLCKIKLESVEEDLEYTRAYAEIQAKQANNGLSDSSRELRKLKCDYEKLVHQNKSEVSTLLSERDFVQRQLKRVEDEYDGLLRIKSDDLDAAQLNVCKLQGEVAKIHVEMHDKDIALASLQDGIEDRDREVERLSHALALLLKELQCMRTEGRTSEASFNSHTLMALYGESSGEQHGAINDTNRKAEDDQPSSLLRNLKEMSKEMELKNIAKENLQKLCPSMQYQRRKLKHQTNSGCSRREDISRKLCYELKTTSTKEADGDALSKNYSQQKETPNGHELFTGDPSVGSKTPLKKEQKNEAPKSNHSSRRKRAKSDPTKSGVHNLFDSSFKIPKLKALCSMLE